jgi:hypothetical protein
VVVRKYQEQGIHCPLTALTRQLSPTDPGIRPIVGGLLADWHRRIADGIRRRPDEGGPAPDPANTATAILVAIQGGVTMLHATEEIHFLEVALDAALAPLSGPRGTGAVSPRPSGASA